MWHDCGPLFRLALVAGMLGSAACLVTRHEPSPVSGVSGMRTLAILGDSIGRGGAASRSTRTFAHQLETLRPDLNVLNYSRGGWTAAPPRSALPFLEQANAAAIPALVPHFVLIELGTNDWSANVTRDAFDAAYRNVLAWVMARRATTYCLTPLWRRGVDPDGRRNAAGLSLDDYRAIIRRDCTAAGATPLDGLRAVPHSTAYFADGLHPNDRGNQKLAQFLAAAIR
jgi:lysophospholipase L1-like esterase